MTIYDRVKVLTDAKKMTVKAVETACGLGNGSIKKWETSMPKVDVLYKVAQYFDTSIEYFLTGKHPDLDEMEKVIIEAYRESDADGKANIIQVCMNERDLAEKRDSDNVG